MCGGNSKRLCDDNTCQECFNKSFASCNRAQFWSNKNQKNSRQVFKYTAKKYWFNCDKCNHEFEAKPDMINRQNNWCTYCGDKQLCTDEDCIDCFDRSFASTDRVHCWSNKNILPARQIFKNTAKKYWFNCDNCNHEFESKPNNIVSKGDWCPYCCVPSKKICHDEDCINCFNKSFASCDKSKYWSNTNILPPRHVFKSSDSKYRFDCDICNHQFEIQLNCITNQESWCPYCSGKQLCQDDKCVNCFNRSFASHPKAIYWSDKNAVNPESVSKYSHCKYWFNCDNCKHEFESVISYISSGSWCPKCVNKTELKLYNMFKDIGYDIESQLRADWCRNPETNSYLPFDFLLEEYKIIIELDGRQHFEQVSNWKTPEETQKLDKYKMNCANKQGYTIIRIFQEDVWCDRIDWLAKLEEHIYLHDVPTKIYISSGNHYDIY
ncbi:Restriction endonuclease [Pacmanvirus A23]|uniref:HNH endonuclease n=1 Tax=Pacmanvirus A23 TaxID=1932881 RepID=UPI000A09333A|nr:HNH endonuclease [Pacmanvirus A23]SIP85904.1 Restriction endonuclease [Pacmanvirus A23]